MSKGPRLRHHVGGIHAVRHLLHHAPERVLALYLARPEGDPRCKPILEAAEVAGTALRQATGRELERLVGHERHQGVVAEIRPRPPIDENGLIDLVAGLTGPALLLVLDQVQDPHNLGACMRSADAAGAHAVVIPRNRAATLTPAVRKVASGAAETVPLARVTNLARTLRGLSDAGIRLVGAAEDGEGELYGEDLRGPVAIVMGAEGQGMRRLTREHCDTLVSIPMRGTVESLNVAVAAGVCLFEAVRQRR